MLHAGSVKTGNKSSILCLQAPLSFAYKLRSPDDAVLSQYNSLSTNNKQVENKYVFSDLCHFGTARHQTMSRQMKQDCLACRYTKGITVSALMRQFYQDRVSINHVGAVCAVDCDHDQIWR